MSQEADVASCRHSANRASAAMLRRTRFGRETPPHCDVLDTTVYAPVADYVICGLRLELMSGRGPKLCRRSELESAPTNFAIQILYQGTCEGGAVRARLSRRRLSSPPAVAVRQLRDRQRPNLRSGDHRLSDFLREALRHPRRRPRQRPRSAHDALRHPRSGSLHAQPRLAERH